MADQVRKPGDQVVIGIGITVTVVEVKGNRVRVGIDAPNDVRILRAELACWQDEPAARASQPNLHFCAESKLSDRSGNEIGRLVTASNPGRPISGSRHLKTRGSVPFTTVP